MASVIRYLLALLSVVVVVVVVVADDLQVGTSVNGQLAYAETVKLSAIPLTTRTKNVFYSDEANRVIKVRNRGPSQVDIAKRLRKRYATKYTDRRYRSGAKGISALDMAKKDAQATVTAGGVGSTFANVRLKSKRGEGLDYQVQFFV